MKGKLKAPRRKEKPQLFVYQPIAGCGCARCVAWEDAKRSLAAASKGPSHVDAQKATRP